MYARPSVPANTKSKVHCPTSLLTIAPGRPPGQAVTPNGAAVGTSMSRVGTPPSVQFGAHAMRAPGAARTVESVAARIVQRIGPGIMCASSGDEFVLDSSG